MEESLQNLAGLGQKYKKLFASILDFFKKRDYRSILPKLPFYLLIFSVLYYIIIFSIYTILLHEVYYTQAFDAGIQDQGTWLLSRLINPFITLRGINYFGDSFRLITVLWAGLLWIWDSINILFIAQAVFVAIGAIPLFLYAKRKLNSSWLALTVGLSFLLYPALQNMNLEQYHPEIFTLAFVIFMVYFLLIEKQLYYFIFLFLSLAGKDDVVFTVAFIGAYLWLFKKEKRQGIATIGIAVAWYIFNSRIICPIFNNIGIFAPQPITYSHWFRGLMANLLNPIYYFQNIFNSESMIYILGLFAPLLFVPFLNFEMIFILIPSIAVNILSGVPYLRSIEYHYNYVQTGLIFFAFIGGLSFLQNTVKNRITDPTRINIYIGTTTILCALIANTFLSHFPLINNFSEIRGKTQMLQSDMVYFSNQGLAMIPKNARVSASYSLAPHLSHRKEIYMFPNPFKSTLWNQWFMEGKDEPPAIGHVDYIAISLGNHDQEDKNILSYLVASGRFKIIYHNGDIIILEKTNTQKTDHLGALYTLYNFDKSISINDNFKEKLTINKKGVVSNIYFPPSNYYLRNIPGEDIPAIKPVALEITGYAFFPGNDTYSFDLKSDAKCQVKIDDKDISGPTNLSQGFHKFLIKYLNTDSRYNIQLTVNPRSNKAYIIPDNFLIYKNDPAYFNNFIAQYRNAQNALFLSSQSSPNLILNGGFETIFGSFPKNWHIESWESKNAASSAFSVSSKIKKAGNHSIKIQNQYQADSRFVQEIKVKPNTFYKLSGWIKTSDVTDKGTGAHLEIEGTSIRTEAIIGSHDWRYFEAQGRTGRAQTKIKILCRLGDYGAPTTGTAYFDEIKLNEINLKDNI